jgi:dTMP kinase
MSRFIVLEGIDGAGTTTQAARLAQALEARGETVVRTREPTDGPVGRLIRATLQGAEGALARSVLPWLFAADRADHLARVVEPALADGRWVVSDRYLHSSLAYQSLELPLDDVFALNRTFRPPDLTVFLDVPVEVGLARVADRGDAREIYEQHEALTRIARVYDRVLVELAARGDAIVRIPGTAPVDRVAERVLDAVLDPS